MSIVPLGPWTPDKPAIRNVPFLIDAQGCLPSLEGYVPLPGLSVTTNALNGQCLGAVSTRDILQSGRMFAGDSTKLYENVAGTWTDRSKAAGYGPAISTTRWRFTTFGDRLIAVNGIDPPQYRDMSIGTLFADLAGSPGAAQYIATFGEFVFLASTSASGMTMKWSAFNDSTGWTPGTNQSDTQDFADGGRLTGLATGTNCLYVFQEKAIRRVLYVGGALIFQIDKLVEEVGVAEPNSLIEYGQRFFYLSDDGFYQFDGISEPQPLGVEAWANWFVIDADRTYWRTMSGAIDPHRKIAAWAYASKSSAMGVPDSILFYNYALDRAAYARMDLEFIIGGMSISQSRDDAAFAALSADDAAMATLSSDDPAFQGGTFYFAAFCTTHKLGSFASSNVAAILQTGAAPISNDASRVRVEWVKPIADTTNATVAAGSQVRAGDVIVFGSDIAQQASGKCPQRGVNGFFAAAKVKIPAASTWTYINGLDFKANAAGKR